MEPEKKYNVLFVDDNEPILETIKSFFRKEKDLNLSLAQSAKEGMKIFQNENLDLIISDLKMPGMNGIEFLERVRKISNEIPFLILSGFQDISLVVEAMKKGAQDYLVKPIARELLIHAVRKTLKETSLKEEIRRLRQQVQEKHMFENMVGVTPSMHQIFDKIRVLSETDATVLILGETGTGKELVARAIHRQSSRSRKPLIKINCAAISETLLESELFGHEKGAFTGAIKTKQGKFELGDRGSIFLDEIGDISPNMQSRLLRVLQEQEFERVGGVETIKVNVRIIAATNANLQKAMEKGRFRPDLYYRLNVFPITLPPLRERKEDVPLLAEHFLKYYNKNFNRNVKYISNEAMERLMAHNWSGNVRELENVIERAVIVSQDETISPEDIGRLQSWKTPQEIISPPVNPDKTYIEIAREMPYQDARNAVMEQLDIKYLEEALSKTGGSISKTSKILGLSSRSIYEKMKKYDIDKSEYKGG